MCAGNFSFAGAPTRWNPPCASPVGASAHTCEANSTPRLSAGPAARERGAGAPVTARTPPAAPASRGGSRRVCARQSSGARLLAAPSCSPPRLLPPFLPGRTVARRRLSGVLWRRRPRRAGAPWTSRAAWDVDVESEG